MIVDGGTAVDPLNGADDHVQPEHQSQREQDEQEEVAVCGAPERQLPDVEPYVVMQERLDDVVGDTLPGEHDRPPPVRELESYDQAERRTPDQRGGEQRR